MCKKKKRIEIKMEVGWIIVIGVFGMLAVIGKCGELYYNSRRVSLPPDTTTTNLLLYNA